MSTLLSANQELGDIVKREGGGSNDNVTIICTVLAMINWRTKMAMKLVEIINEVLQNPWQ